MKRFLVFFVSVCALMLLLNGCQSAHEPENANLVFKNDEGSVLATEFDLLTGSTQKRDEYETERQTIEIAFEDPELLEEITETNLHKQIHIYFYDELIASPRVAAIIKNGSVVIEGDISKEQQNEMIELINR